MKKLALILISIGGALCILLCFLGMYYDRKILIYLGAAAISGSILLALIAAVTVNFVRSYKNDADSEDWSDPMTAFTTTDRYSVAEYIFGRGLVGFRMAPKKAKILSYLLSLFVILTLFCGILLLFLQITIPGVICLCCFGVTVFICMVSAVLRFIFTLGKAMKKAKDEEQELNREQQELLDKFEREEFEYNVATVIRRTLLPSPDYETEESGKKWYEYVLEIDGNRHKVKHSDFFESDQRVVVYSLGELIFINGPKSKELQKQEEQTK